MKKILFLILCGIVLSGCVDTTQPNDSLDFQEQISELLEENRDLRTENRELEEKLNAKDIEYDIATDALRQQLNNREDHIEELEAELGLLDPTLPHSDVLQLLLNYSFEIFYAYHTNNEMMIDYLITDESELLSIDDEEFTFSLETLVFEDISVLEEDMVEVIFAEVNDKSQINYRFVFEKYEDQWKLVNFTRQ
ncbi:hypothetical protein [Alkalihalobacillus pseudalcaliphilus]|uniref:hypothetical protein n=1 Tax=Alkalihalobacillus pseudalcaliphilus TaxID=79884 RepID=UPI00064DFBF5|nr:hypothetical protein [Alkalihalobacillus pseudalcaliphilus]KMK76202.1 hypothetical protein AB990_13375 [Alkalihalobacillus pseudalcaliphilus]